MGRRWYTNLVGDDNLNDLDVFRKTIDKCDMEIVQAIEKRFSTVKQIVQYKKDNNLEIYQPDREQQVLEKVDSYLTSNEFSEELKSLYTYIMEISKEIQERSI